MQTFCVYCKSNLEVLVVVPVSYSGTTLDCKGNEIKTGFTNYQENIFFVPYYPLSNECIKEIRCPMCGLLYSAHRP